MKSVSAVVVLVSMLAARAVNAEPPPAAPGFTPELGIGAVAGHGTPLGDYGLEATVAPLPWLVVTGGLGRNDDGNQAALAARARTPGSYGLYAAIGLAGGHYAAWLDDDFGPRQLVGEGRALWSTFEFGFEADSEHVDFRAFAGTKQLANAGTVCFAGADPHAECDHGGYVGLALDVH